MVSSYSTLNSDLNVERVELLPEAKRPKLEGGNLLPVTTSWCVKQLNQQSNILQITSINQNVKNIGLFVDTIHTNAVSHHHSRQDNFHDFKSLMKPVSKVSESTGDAANEKPFDEFPQENKQTLPLNPLNKVICPDNQVLKVATGKNGEIKIFGVKAGQKLLIQLSNGTSKWVMVPSLLKLDEKKATNAQILTAGRPLPCNFSASKMEESSSTVAMNTDQTSAKTMAATEPFFPSTSQVALSMSYSTPSLENRDEKLPLISPNDKQITQPEIEVEPDEVMTEVYFQENTFILGDTSEKTQGDVILPVPRTEVYLVEGPPTEYLPLKLDVHPPLAEVVLVQGPEESVVCNMDNIGDRPYCTLCRRHYCNLESLQEHISSQHTERGEPFTCPCGANFRTKYERTIHRKNGHDRKKWYEYSKSS